MCCRSGAFDESGRRGAMDPTTAPALRSFLPVPPESHFPIQNLPYGVFRRRGGRAHVGVAIGDWVLDLAVVEARGLLAGPAVAGRRLFDRGRLNDFMALGRPAWAEVRATVSRLLSAGSPALRDDPSLREHALVPLAEAEMLLPAEVGDYTDFYS